MKDEKFKVIDNYCGQYDSYGHCIKCCKGYETDGSGNVLNLRSKDRQIRDVKHGIGTTKSVQNVPIVGSLQAMVVKKLMIIVPTTIMKDTVKNVIKDMSQMGNGVAWNLKIRVPQIQDVVLGIGTIKSACNVLIDGL